MLCVVNGQPMELPEHTTVADLIARLGLSDAICAAEVDRELVPKRERAGRVLRPGERVEVVTLVGGG
jgi:thiamine biosynthesis protein ThiS